MRDHEDVSRQAEARDKARLDLKVALSDLSVIAKRASRDMDLAPVFGAMSKVSRAEEAYDIAELDLATARGADA